MSAFAIILILLIVGAAIISVYSQVKPAQNILWIAVLLLSIAVALLYGGAEHVWK